MELINRSCFYASGFLSSSALTVVDFNAQREGVAYMENPAKFQNGIILDQVVRPGRRISVAVLK